MAKATGTCVGSNKPMIDTPNQPETDLVRVHRDGWNLLLRPEIRGTELEGLLLGGSASLERRYRLERVRSAATAGVFRFALRLGDSERAVYYKEYLHRSVLDTIKHLVRACRPVRAFNASAMLAASGFGVPETVALGERRVLRWLQRCFLMTFEVEAAETLIVALSRDPHLRDRSELRARRELIRTMGTTIGRMHREGIVHGDLRLGNVLARREQGQWQLFFLDNERTQKFSRLSDRLRLKNLVQVNMFRQGVSSTDRLRFFQAYLSECPELRPHCRWWAQRILARTAQRMMARQHHRGVLSGRMEAG